MAKKTNNRTNSAGKRRRKAGDEIDLSPSDEKALDKAWAKVGNRANKTGNRTTGKQSKSKKR
jgi:hypothetical protein